jgi:hypothetical protein
LSGCPRIVSLFFLPNQTPQKAKAIRISQKRDLFIVVLWVLSN